MTWTALAVRGSVAAATVAWAAAEWLRLRHPARGKAARAFWTAGVALLVVHCLAVFHYVHGWSQDAALEHTARQTAALTGLDWGGGLYVNYAFVGLWALDAFFWWRDPAAYERRTPIARDTLLAVFLFMFVNAGIVFAHGPARSVGIAAVAAVAVARIGKSRRLR